MKTLKYLSGLVSVALMVAACGGSGEDGDANTPPATTPPPATDPNPAPNPGPTNPGPITAGEPIAGVWLGTLTWNDIYHDHPYDWDATEIVLPNGDYYHVFNHYYHYATETQRNTMGGFAAGKVTTQDGRFTLSEAYEFSFINDFPDRAISGSGTYQRGAEIRGELAYDPRFENGQDLTRAFVVTPGSTFSGRARLEDLRFNNTDHNSIQGVLWTQRSARADGSFKTPMHLVVRPDGSLGARFADQCQVSGRLTPHDSVKVFEATLNLGANCPHAGLTFRGVAYVKDSFPTDTAPTATENRLHLIATNNDGGVRRGILFVQMVQGQIQPEDAPPAPGH